MRYITTLLAAAFLLTGTAAQTQSPPASRYRVLATNKLSTLQKELAQAVDEGYRVIASARPAAAIKVLVLERSTEKRDFFISDALARDVRSEKLAPGYRVLLPTVGATGNALIDGPCGGVLERTPDDTVRRDYLVVDAIYPGNLQKDILTAAAEGYRVAVIGVANEFCALLEREGGAPGTPITAEPAGKPVKEKKVDLTKADYTRPYVLIATTKTSTLEKEMADAVAHGFRLQSGTASVDVEAIRNEFVYLMERGDANAARPDYVYVSTSKTETFEREINAAAARGYRLHPLSLTGVVHSLSGSFETVAVMEKRESPPIEYRVIGAARAGTFEKELAAAGEESWEFVALVKSGAFTAVMQKAK